MTKKARVVWQDHHISYQDRDGSEWMVKVRRSVHFIITRLGRYSRGFTMKEKAALHCAIEQLPTVREDEVK